MIIVHTLESTDISQGGPARSVPQLARSLQRPGNKITLYANHRKPSTDQEDEAISHIPLVSYGGNFRSFLEEIGNVTLVHDHGLWQTFHRAIAEACGKQRIIRIVSPRGMLEPWSLNHKKWKKRLALWLYQKSDLQSAAALHATADSEATQLRKLGFTQPIILAANGVDLPSFPDQGRTTQGQGPKTALFLSRVHPKKGLPMLLDAWASLRPQGWQLQIVGPDESGHVAELKQQCARLGLSCADTAPHTAPSSSLSACVSFSPSLEGDAKWQAFQDADLFILPTNSENFGIAIAEAMAAGLPVITTHGAPWKILEQEHCGWWVPVNTESITTALADAIKRAPEELAAMGARGRKVVKERFSWATISEDMLSSYSWLLHGGEKPDCVLTI